MRLRAWHTLIMVQDGTKGLGGLFLSFTWKLLLAGVVEVLVDGGRDPTWHPPRLQVRPVRPNLRTTCSQASEDVFWFSLPIFHSEKEKVNQIFSCFPSWRFLCASSSSSWLQGFVPFGTEIGEGQCELCKNVNFSVPPFKEYVITEIYHISFLDFSTPPFKECVIQRIYHIYHFSIPLSHHSTKK